MTHRLGVGVFLCVLSFLSVASQAQTVTFIDQGAPATVLLDGSTVKVRVVDAAANTGPGRDTVTVTVTSDLAGDSESLSLLETGPGTGVFEGVVELEPNGSAYGYAPALTTATNPAGPARDTLQATYPANGATASAGLVGSRITFLGDRGRESTSFEARHPVGVRVRDEMRNNSLSRDSFTVTAVSQSTSYSVTVTVVETGMNTGVFEGSFGTVQSSEGLPPGSLVVAIPDVVSIDLLAGDGVTSATAQAQIAGSRVVLHDGDGEPAGTLLESAPVHVLLIAPSTSQNPIFVQVTAGQSGDTETLFLQYAEGDNYTGQILTQTTFSPPIPGDGILQISPYSGPSSQPDAVTVTYTGGEYDPGTASASATFVNSRIAFVDARGRETSSYAVGSEAHIRFESQTANTAALDLATVRLKTQGGFNEQFLELVETRRDSGVFTGSMPLQQLGVQVGDRIEASYSPDLPAVTADIIDVSLEFLDERGEPTEEIVESGPARVRMQSVSANTNSSSVDSAAVEMRVRLSNDLEPLTLTETGPNTGVFEGSISLEMGSYGSSDGKLQTANTGPPDYRQDEVMARSGPVEATARTIGARIEFVDAAGGKVSGYAVGEMVRLRIIDHFWPAYHSPITVTLVGRAHNDAETLTMQETAPGTHVFEGAMPTALYSPVPAGADGKLTVDLADEIEVRHVTGFSPIEITARTAIRGNAIRFVDAAGQPATVYLESSRAYVQVVSAIHNSSLSYADSVTVQIRGEISPDVETLTLTETGLDTGVFAGSIQMRFTPYSFSSGNGVLETHEAGNANGLHEFDTVRATFFSPYGGDAVARIGLTGSRTWFGNAAGTEVLSYAVGTTAHVWVEDQNRNQPGSWDTVSVEVRSLDSGDPETLQLQETTRDSGIFHGTIELVATLALGDGELYVAPGEQIEASHQDAYGATASSAVADVSGSSLEFIDEDGQPTSTLLERGDARVRVFSVYGNTSASIAETVSVHLQARNSYDQETLVLTETGLDTSVFEGSIPMAIGSGYTFSGTLETMVGGYPYGPDVVTAQLDGQAVTAQVVGARVAYLDAYGGVTTSYVVGETVRVRVTDHSRNSTSTGRDLFSVSITSRDGGDSEPVAMQETGFDTGVFVGSVPSVFGGGASPNNGQLSALPDDQVEIRYQPYSGAELVATAAMQGNAVRFIDAAGQPATVYLESSRAYVRVISISANTSPSSADTVPVQLLAELSQDTETLTLTETGASTNVFEGSIPLRLVPGTDIPGNGILETIEDGHAQYDPPHQVDTLRATYSDPAGTSVARIGLTGSRTWFADATGQEVLSYPVGGTAHVRVEDQNRNQPGVWDTVYVELRSLGNGDMEWLQLRETTRDSGVFAISLELAGGTAQTGDGKLQVMPGSQIEAIHLDAFGATASSAVADISALSITFIDEIGEPTAELLERGEARVRMFYVAGNSNPYTAETHSATLQALRSNDTESLTLTETGLNTGVFEGSLSMQVGGGASGDVVLSTINSGSPDYLPEEVSAVYGDQRATALVQGARVRFVDANGRETASYAAGESVRLRVVDHSYNQPVTRDNVGVTVTSRDGADSQTLTLAETGFNTAVFEGSLPTTFGGTATPFDNRLRVYPGDEVEARYEPNYSPNQIVATAAITGNAVLFVDTAGQPATVYLESSKAYVRVVSTNANTNASQAETVPVLIAAELSGDLENLSLTETGPNTGVFEGSIQMRLVPGTQLPGNGILETTEDGHPTSDPPHEFDTLRVSYSDPAGASVARIGLTGSRTWFADAAGQEVLSYPLGGTAYVRVEDQNRNQPGVWDTVYVEVRFPANGDLEQVQLLETTRDSGVFAIALELVNSNSSQSGDGKLQVVPGYQIEATHQDAYGATASSAVADISASSMTFVDETGEPTTELLERGVARVRVLSLYSNTNPFTTETRTVVVQALRSGDTESLTVTETGPDTSVFEGSLPMQVGGGADGDNVLSTLNSGSPEYLPDQVTAEYGGSQTTALVMGARVRFVDAYGRETARYAAGESVRLRVVDHNYNQPVTRDNVGVTVISRDGADSDILTLLETGFDTAVFEGALPTTFGGTAMQNDNRLRVYPGDEVEARYEQNYSPNRIVATAAITGNAVLFVDAAGQPATVYLESSKAYVRVVSKNANTNASSAETVPALISAELSGDTENLGLTETGPNTGVFEGSIQMRLVPGTQLPGNGILETTEDGHPTSDPPHEFDTLRVSYGDPAGTSVATIGLTGSRTWFGDAAGQPVESYAIGSTAWVWVEDQNRNQRGVWDTVYVEVRSLGNEDLEQVQLLETTRDSGVFVIALELANGPLQSGDGKLQAMMGYPIRATHQDAYGATSSTAEAGTTDLSITFLDEAGEPTTELLEGGEVRVRMFNLSNNNPGTVETRTITLRTLRSGDDESVTLTETGLATGIFEGSIPMQVGGGADGDNVLSTLNSGSPAYLPDEVSAHSGGLRATALVLGARVRFVDAYGRETASYAAGESVRLRVVDHNYNQPVTRDNVGVTVTSRDGTDSQTLTLAETGFDTAVFEGSLPTTFGGTATAFDNRLRVYPDDVVEAQYEPNYSPNRIVATAAITGNAVLFVDAAGQPATVYLESSKAYVRVVSKNANTNTSLAETVPALIVAELSGDTENLGLTETGPSTGVFEGSIPLRLVPGTQLPGNGILETTEDGHPTSDPPHEFDTLRASYSDPAGASVATIGLTGSRTWFGDAMGQEVESYPARGTVYVWVEDQNRNQRGVWDTVYAEVRTDGSGDLEQVELRETTRDSGVFVIALELAGGGVQSGDGKLQAMTGYPIRAVHQDAYGATSSTAVVGTTDLSITFIDETGEPTKELLETGEARVRMFSFFHNSDPYTAQTSTVTLQALRSGDTESVTLTETGPDTGIFEGSIPMQVGGGADGDGVLSTINSGSPEYLPDQVRAEYGDSQATALVMGARVRFVDGYGRETASYAAGESVRLRVVDHNYNQPVTRDNVGVTLTSRDGADSQTLTLLETGFDTAVFEGSLPTTFGGTATAFDNRLRVYPDDVVEAQYEQNYSPNKIVATAAITGNAVLFVDAAGQPATVYLESSKAYVRVVSKNANTNTSLAETVPVLIVAELSGDDENLSLIETGPNTGVFEGSIPLRLVPGTQLPGNGILETTEDGHPTSEPPHEFDTLRASYSDPAGASVATIGLTGSRTWFGDAAGQEVESFAIGDTAWVWVEDQNRNQRGVWDTVYVEVRSLGNSEVEQLELRETTRDSGVFAFALELENSTSQSGDGKLQAMMGYPIRATHQDAYGATSSTAEAGTSDLSVTFLDETGEPTTELLEKGQARVRMLSVYQNSSPSTVETSAIALQALRSGDEESVTLTETGPNTGIFEGSIPMQVGGGADGDGVLSTLNSGSPEYLPDQVSAHSGGLRATALVLGARVRFVDAYGRETASYAAGESVRLRVVDHNYNQPVTRDNVGVTVTSRDGADSDILTLLETGFDTAVFEGALPTTFGGTATQNDNRLRVYPGDEVEAHYEQNYSPNRIVATAAITGNAVLFVDAAGQPATVYLESSKAYVRVVSKNANTNTSLAETVPALIVAELSGDDENLTLTETGPNTGVFEGSIQMRLAPGTQLPGNGILETTEDGHPTSDPPHELDTLRASYSDPAGASVARIGLTGSRTWFGDAAGQEVLSYAVGGTAYIWVEDQNRNQPGVRNLAYVEVRSLGNSEQEQVVLWETTRDSGVFVGSLALTSSPTLSYDEKLMVMPGYQIEAVHADAYGATASSAIADISDLSITFIDETGEPTTELLERGDARVRLFSLSGNADPNTAETRSITLQTLRSGDVESLTLTETGRNTGVFEGSISMQVGGGADGDGVLSTMNSGSPAYLPEEVSAVSGNQRATARALGARVTFVDAYGGETAAYAAGESVRVRVVDHNYNQPSTRDNVGVTVTSRDGTDSQTLALLETGFDTAVFEGSLPTTFGGTATPFDNLLRVYPNDEVEARYEQNYSPNEIVATAAISGNAVLFIDAAGEPASVYLESSRAFVRVVSTNANTNPSSVEMVPVQLLGELSQDAESLTLTETGPNTSVFEGSIPMRLVFGTQISGNGILETIENGHPRYAQPHEVDTVRATYSDPSGTSVARIGLTGSRVWFVNAAGQEVSSYPRFGTVHVRLEDQNRNQPGVQDNYWVGLNAPSGDFELVQVLEIGLDSGIFAGSVPLGSDDNPESMDGVLGTDVGDQIEAGANHYYTSYTYSSAFATITAAGVEFIDETGAVTEVLLEGGVARIRVFQANGNPLSVETLTVQLQAAQSGDVESLTLTETGGNTNLFEGTIPMSVGGGLSNNGTLQTLNSGSPDFLPDVVTALFSSVYGSASGTATVQPSRVDFVNLRGQIVSTYPQGSTVRVRVTDHNGNVDPGLAETLMIEVHSQASGDTEQITLTETGPDTGVFEGSVPSTGTGSAGADGVLVAPPGLVETQHGNVNTPEMTSAQVTILSTPAPVAVDDTATVVEDDTVLIEVLANDTGTGPLTLGSVTQPAHGSLATWPDHKVTYTPAAGYVGSDTFTYLLVDAEGGEDMGTVTVTVTPANQAPTPAYDSATTPEDQPVVISVLANDTDPDNDSLRVVAVTQPAAGGTVVINPDEATVTYTPAPNASGSVVFQYTVRDSQGLEGTSAVTVTITPVNDPPVANDDTVSTPEDTAVTIDAMANDSDIDSATYYPEYVSSPGHGTAELQPDHTIIYTPNANFTGSDYFVYTLRDDAGVADVGTVTITVTAINDQPAANPDTAFVAEDGSSSIEVLTNDTDPENDALDVTAVTQGTNGSVVLNANDTVTYTPNANFSGTDSFTYTISDGNGGTATGTVTITITTDNDGPTANTDSATVAEDGSITVSVLNNDTDPENDALDVTAVTQGANGTVTLNANDTVTYAPNASFHGTDSFTYTISDGNGGTASATVAVTVTSVNDEPVANSDTASLAEDASATVSVLGNDTDPDNDVLSVASVTQGAHGSVAINPDKTVIYTPVANYNGSDLFTYTISDGNGGTATATVSITITPVNDQPVANADSASSAENGSVTITVLGNDTDVDNDTLSVTAVTQGAHGTVVINPNKTVTYTPAAGYVGSDTFTYTISDGNGGTATASVSVSINNVNDAPVANSDTASLAEDTSVTVTALGNDTDPDNDVLSVASVTQGAHGSVAINPDKTVTYTPGANYNGSDTFTYTAADGNGGTAMATVTVTITPVNDAPVAVNDTASTVAETLTVISVLNNDVDIDGPSLAVASVTQPAHGTVTVNANQTVNYTPASAYVGADSFTYTVTDGAGGTATATVNVTVSAPPRVATNLQVLYELEEGSGTTVTDTSGVGTPLNLTIGSAAAVSWISGGLSVNSATLIQSAGAATKVISACQSTNAITMEAWIEPTSTSQTGPIATVSQQSNKEDFSLNQSGNRWTGILRTSNTNQGGSGLSSATGTATLNFTHVVYTRDASGNVRIYVNGVQSASTTLAGNFSSWTSTYKLGLVNELASGSPWRGKLYLVAIYNRALSSAEVRQNWLAGE